MLTIMLEAEAANAQAAPLPPMQCYGGPAEEPAKRPETPEVTPPPTPPRTPSPQKEPTPPVTPRHKTPSPIRTKTPEPKTPSDKDSNCGGCMDLKRQEIDFELDQLRRET